MNFSIFPMMKKKGAIPAKVCNYTLPRQFVLSRYRRFRRVSYHIPKGVEIFKQKGICVEQALFKHLWCHQKVIKMYSIISEILIEIR